MKLSVIIPVYNEKDTIKQLVDRVEAVNIDKEIIIVDDGSTDETRKRIYDLYEGKEGFKTFYHEKNMGKGAAIRTGLGHVSGDIVLIQDADLEYDPQDYLVIAAAFDDPLVDVVYGTRFKDFKKSLFLRQWFEKRFLGKKHEIKRFHHYFGIQALNVLVNVLYATNITDEATCYKAFRKEVLKRIHLRCTGFEFCPEVTAKIRKAGYKITEVPISYRPRSHEEGKKLNWKHGVEAITTLVKYRFVD